MSGQLVKEIAKEQEVERKAKAIGGSTAGADLQCIGGVSQKYRPSSSVGQSPSSGRRRRVGSAESADADSGD